MKVLLHHLRALSRQKSNAVRDAIDRIDDGIVKTLCSIEDRGWGETAL
jgi:hypothetical protein